MNVLNILAALCGAGLAAGLLFVVRGLMPSQVRTGSTGAIKAPRLGRHQLLMLGLGLGLGIVGWVLTGWILAMVLAPLAVFGLPYLLGGGKQAQKQIDRLEAVEEWVRLVATRLSSGTSVEQALISSAFSAPAAIQPEVERLSTSIRQGRTTPDAVHLFAAELSSPVGDLVSAELIQASRSRSHGVAQALNQLAEHVSTEVSMHRQIEAERSKPRTTARLVILLTLGAAVLLAMVGDFMDPYATASGQMVLALIAACFVLAMVWMRRLTTPAPSPRFLVEEGA